MREQAENLATTVRLRFWTCHRSHDPGHPNPVPTHDCPDCKTVRDADAALARLVAAAEEREEARLERDLYEAMTKAVEQALFGNDMGRSRDEIVEAAVAAAERTDGEVQRLATDLIAAEADLEAAEAERDAALARVAELEAQASALNSTSAYLTLVTAEQTRIDCDLALVRVEQLETALREAQA